MYEDVKTGNSIACFEDYPVMGYGITQGNGTEDGNGHGKRFLIRLCCFEGARTQNCFDMFNAGLKNIKENGKYQEILDNYISAE